MNPFTSLIEFILHLSDHLSVLINQYGFWTYLILFAIVFCETGLVVFPFLPGDSLIFAAGTLAAIGAFDPVLLFIIFVTAAIAGDTINYWIGYFSGPKIFKEKVRFLKKEYLDRTEKFYEKYGGKTIFLARFIPIIRTFAPFVAGVGKMNYTRFIIYNILGAIAWVALFLGLGFWFGNVAFVKTNFGLVLIAIIIISLIPALAGYLHIRHKK